MKKELNKVLDNGKTCLWTGRSNTIKILQTKHNPQIQCNLIKIPMVSFTELENTILKQKAEKTLDSQNNSKQKEHSWRNQIV